MMFEEGWVSCGCCAGLEWGGEYPRECRSCGGNGQVYRYPSGRLALWPGGPLMGSEHPDYARKVIAHVD
jgi:hypothetical protein